MLGVKDSHTALSGENAKRFLTKLIRVQTGNLTEEDKRDLEIIKKRKQNLPELKWPDLMLTE